MSTPSYFAAQLYRNLDTDETGALVQAGPTLVHAYVFSNTGAAARYLKLYDKATAPDANDTPAWTVALPAGEAVSVALPRPLLFTNGLGLRATTGVADADTAGPGANEVIVNLGYD